MNRKIIATVILALFASPVLAADDLDNLGALAQGEFENLSEDLNAVLAYRGVQPAEPLGIVGFDIGIEASSIGTEHGSAWATASGDSVSRVPTARLSVNKGLPLGFDVGAFYSAVPGSNIKLYGGQLRYALVEGGVVTPSVGVRAAVTRLEGVDQLAADTRSMDISISKGFGPVTPYLGIGRVWGDFTPDASTGLAPVDVEENRNYVGLRFSMLVMQFSFEAEKMGDRTGYTAKFAFGF